MFIVGCDYYPSFQQIAFVDTETGELREQRLMHREGAEEFYHAFAATGQRVCVGMEASGHARWFERLLRGAEVGAKLTRFTLQMRPADLHRFRVFGVPPQRLDSDRTIELMVCRRWDCRVFSPQLYRVVPKCRRPSSLKAAPHHRA